MISIICPVYNSEKFLKDCIESVFLQTFSDWELILIDDGSTDSSLSICNEYSKKDKRVKVFHKKNEGQWLTREYGIKNSAGDFFVFLDSDDLLSPNALSIINNEIKKYNPDIILYDICRLENDGSTVILQNLNEHKFLDNNKDIIFNCFVNNNCISLCVYCFRRSYYECNKEKNIFNKKIKSQEDFLMLFGLLKKAINLCVIPQVLYIYRNNINSTSNNLKVEDYFSNILISDYIYKTIDEMYQFEFDAFAEKIKRRLAWQPISLIKRTYLFCEMNIKKKYFKILRNSYIYNNFTKKYSSFNKKERLILVLFKYRFHFLNRLLLKYECKKRKIQN